MASCLQTNRRLSVYVRHGQVDRGLRAEEPALLLEGAWPAETDARRRWSLDEAINGSFEWIDGQAADFAELLGRVETPHQGCYPPTDAISAAYLNALALRYYLVKLIRPIAYFTEVWPLRRGDRVELTAGDGDKEYAELIGQLCRSAGARYCVRRVDTGKACRIDTAQGRRGRFPANARWRRWAARLCRLFEPPADRSASNRRVVLCGNPRLLDPVCRELLRRGCRVWWLYDRFAVKAWLRWHFLGAEQLLCDSSLGRHNRLAVRLPEQIDFRGVNLAAPLRRWLARRAVDCGPRQTRLAEQIEQHFARLRPAALVLDQDATPTARAAVAVGRRHGVGSFVVQHGAPCCRFGFSPPAADHILAWGRSSEEQLIRWGVPPARICITGSPQRLPRGTVPFSLRENRDSARRNSQGSRDRARPPRILLLATVPPRHQRPDAAVLHLTGSSYAEMIRTAFVVVAAVADAELIVKLHPRAADDPAVRAARAEFAAVRSRVVRRGSLEKWLAGVDCVLSCLSGAGIEAMHAGLPVIQLLPPGAGDVLPHSRWGLLGSARSEAELRRLLDRVLRKGWPPEPGARAGAFADSGPSAAARVADKILDSQIPIQSSQEPSRFSRNADATVPLSINA